MCSDQFAELHLPGIFGGGTLRSNHWVKSGTTYAIFRKYIILLANNGFGITE